MFCKNRYNLSELKRDLNILYFFCADVSAHKASKEVDLSYRAIIDKYIRFRHRIADYLEEQPRTLGRDTLAAPL